MAVKAFNHKRKENEPVKGNQNQNLNLYSGKKKRKEEKSKIITKEYSLVLAINF